MSSIIETVHNTAAPILREAFGEEVSVKASFFDHGSQAAVAVYWPDGEKDAVRAGLGTIEDAEKAARELIERKRERDQKPKHYRMIAEGGVFG